MHHTSAELELELINERLADQRREAEFSRLARLARAASPQVSFRQRAGEAVIAFGTRLAGNRGSVREQPRLATRAS
jgi:hypothetical protein